MKPILLLTAAVFALSACDGEKVQEAKSKVSEAGKAAGDASKAIGDAAKEMTGKGMEKAKELSAKGLEKGKEIAGATGQKAKELAGAAAQLVKEKGGPALESFKAKIGGFSEWSKTSRDKMGDDFAKVKAYMSEMNTRLGGISAEGLPEDLKTALTAYQAGMAKFNQAMRSSPADEAGMTKWSHDNADALEKIEQEIMAAAKKLREAAATHGVTGLDLGSLTE